MTVGEAVDASVNATLPDILREPLTLPVVASPMLIASGVELVTAQCQAGVIGSFPALNARSPGLLEEWITRIADQNAAYAASNPDAIVAPFAVNQIVHRSNERLEADLEIIVRHRVPLVITSLGARPEVNEAVHSYGGVVLHDVVSNEYAHKAIEKGADGLIAVAAGAGGHGGKHSPFALLQEIRAWFDGPLLLSGAIAHGRSILAALAAGADFAYVGSAFLATAEANVVPEYKRMLVESTAKDIVGTDVFTGIFGNYLRGSVVARGLNPHDLSPGALAEVRTRASDGEPRAWRDIWGAGHGVGAIQGTASTADLVARLADEYRAALHAMSGRVEERR